MDKWMAGNVRGEKDWRGKEKTGDAFSKDRLFILISYCTVIIFVH